MGMHIFPITCNLSSHYGEVYDRRGAFLLALASLAGWASGLAVKIPTPILVNLVAVVAGGVIVNATIAELPKEREGRYGSFLTGALVYSALLLFLSHFEKGGVKKSMTSIVEKKLSMSTEMPVEVLPPETPIPHGEEPRPLPRPRFSGKGWPWPSPWLRWPMGSRSF